MKFIFALALLCIGAAVAAPADPTPAPNHHGLLEALEKRGEALLERVRKEQHEHRGKHGHLLAALDRQAVLVEALVLDLKKQVADKNAVHHIHHIHVIEEDLLFLENRVSEEIAILHHFIDGHHHHNGDNGAALVARGERLVKEAKDTVAKFPKAKEVREIESEVIVVEALLKVLKAKPAPSADELKKDEEELARHEKTLHQLIEKAAHRKHD